MGLRTLSIRLLLHVLMLVGYVHHSHAGDAEDFWIIPSSLQVFDDGSISLNSVHRKTDVPSDHSCHIYSILRMVFTIVMVALLLLLPQHMQVISGASEREKETKKQNRTSYQVETVERQQAPFRFLRIGRRSGHM
ncbi:hypothetical protein Q8A73_012666 [Channa argus]|nr:hypothetical protein Q8A73_012666 [Channa argus]